MKRHLSRISALALCAAALPALATANNVDSPKFSVMGVVIVWGADGNDPGTANTPIVSDFIINDDAGSTDSDLISGDVFTVVTGELTPVENGITLASGAPMRIQRAVGGGFNTDSNGDGLMNASDSFSAFQIRNNTDTNTRRAEMWASFYVASNTAFNVEAEAYPIGGSTAAQLNQIRVRVRTTLTGTDDGLTFGTAAQFPHSAGTAGGGVPNGRRLSRLNAGGNPRIFQGNQRTAAAPGTIAEQSVRFDMRYQYRSGNIDLSDGAFDANAEVVYTVFIP